MTTAELVGALLIVCPIGATFGYIWGVYGWEAAVKVAAGVVLVLFVALAMSAGVVLLMEGSLT